MRTSRICCWHPKRWLRSSWGVRGGSIQGIILLYYTIGWFTFYRFFYEFLLYLCDPQAICFFAISFVCWSWKLYCDNQLVVNFYVYVYVWLDNKFNSIQFKGWDQLRRKRRRNMFGRLHTDWVWNLPYQRNICWLPCTWISLQVPHLKTRRH